MYANIIKKIDNRTLQTHEIKKFPLFSEHTSYFRDINKDEKDEKVNDNKVMEEVKDEPRTFQN